MKRPDQWIGLQLVCDLLLERVQVIDLREPIDECPTCGSSLLVEVA